MGEQKIRSTEWQYEYKSIWGIRGYKGYTRVYVVYTIQTDAAFAGLSEGCWQKMEILGLNSLRRLSDAGLSSLVRVCPSLVEVWLNYTNMMDEAV